MNNKRHKYLNNPQKSMIIEDINSKIDFLAKKPKLSIREALERTNAIKDLVQKTAFELEVEGNLEESAELYEKITEAYNLASERVPQAYKKLVDSSADFWKSISEAKRDTYKTCEPEPCKPKPKPEPPQLHRRLGLISQPYGRFRHRLPTGVTVSPWKKANFDTISGTTSAPEEKAKQEFWKESFVREKQVRQNWEQIGKTVQSGSRLGAFSRINPTKQQQR